MEKNHRLLAQLILGGIEPVSCNKESSIEYLKEEGLNPESIREEGMRRFKRLQLQMNAAKTKREMVANEKIKQDATDWAERILSDISFSFPVFVKEEKMVLQNRNIESFNKEDIRHTITQYLFMKLLSDSKSSNADQV
ncbi:MAG: hypothetical protein EOO61_16915 [Hymenobacter sp.]|nr:MAG: hypothetical protein EOO61_16915 [Hymenobacter sp.]